MKQINTKAIILKRLAFGEADKILTVLTPEQGIVSMLAKGVRRPKSKLAGGLELLSVSDITYVDGRGELKTVVSARLDHFYRAILTHPAAITTAYECMQLIHKAAEHSEDSFYFLTLQEVFVALDAGVAPTSVFVWCCVRILREQGSVMNLEKPLNDVRFSDDQHYSFSFEDMAFYTDSEGQYTPKQIKFLRVVGLRKTCRHVAQIVEHESISEPLSHLLSRVIGYSHA